VLGRAEIQEAEDMDPGYKVATPGTRQKIREGLTQGDPKDLTGCQRKPTKLLSLAYEQAVQKQGDIQ